MRCFEPTYKEWKLDMRNAIVLKIRGFEPTYKEWKPLEDGTTYTLDIVLSLPTRNGNSLHFPFFLGKAWF